MLETSPVPAPQRVRVHEHLLLAVRRRRAVRGDERGRRAARGRGGGRQRARVRVPRRVRHRADGIRRRRLRRARCQLDDVPQLLEDVRAGRPVLPEKQLARRLVADPNANSARVPAAPGRGRLLNMAAVGEAGGRVPILLFTDIDEPGLNTLEVYERRGGYQALRKALAMSPDEVLEQLEASGIRGRGGAGFAMGTKISFLPKGGDGQVPRVQRRRVRARHVQGPRADAEDAALADRGDRHRLLRRRHEPLVHLHPRRVRSCRPTCSTRRSPKRATRDTSARGSSAPTTRCRSSCTAAPARTSAARRRACSTRSRASAATRA